MVGSTGVTLALVPQPAQQGADPYSAGHTDDRLAMLSHEMRNAIAPVSTALQFLRLSDRSALPNKAHALIERQIGHLSQLVNDLQEMSSVGVEGMRFKPRRFDLREAVPRSVEAVMSCFAHRRHEVVVTLPSDAIWLDADPVRIEQVVVNLVSNAAKYTPDGGRIEIIARRVQDQAELRVLDNGIGMPSEMLPKIFDLFVRVDTSGGYSSAGLGIGLNVVKRIVDLHGGSVSASSAGLGSGSEFVVSLPLASSARQRVLGRPSEKTARRISTAISFASSPNER